MDEQAESGAVEMKNNAEKIQYVMENYYLDEGVVYRRDTHEVVPFNSKVRTGHRFKTIKINGKQISLCIHDAIWMLANNKPLPDGDFEVHHVDFNMLNNDPDNLVLMSNRMHQLYHSCISGSKGYHYRACRPNKSWIAQVKLPIGRRINKCFATEAEAQAFVEYHRAPIIKAFKAMGLPV